MRTRSSSRGLSWSAALAALLLALTSGGTAWALQALPSGGARVNDDPSAGIDGASGISGEDPANAAVVGGALSAEEPAAPWAIFRQGSSAGAKDQLFVRSFVGGTWTTRGSGTVSGRSSAAPTFKGSLNFDQGQDAQAPAIDFAGAGRTVPWATWYENTAGFGAENVFASHLDASGDANQGKWSFAGQGRGTAGGTVTVPSLNIHTNQNAENPSIAGGSTADPTKPGPWVAWQETTALPVNGKNQIFVARSEGPGQANCDGVGPAGVTVLGHVPAIGGSCWQQTGVPRVGPGGADPSLNVDPTRDGIEPDIAFAGPSGETPWVVWYETGISVAGLEGNELVFAAKAVGDGAAADGGFRWEAVGSHLGGSLDTGGANGFGACAASTANEQRCSLNDDPTADAQESRVAAGTMDPASASVPWVAWDELHGGVRQVFVARLVGESHFELANDGQPISAGTQDSTLPDIAFSGNTPYVTWREDLGGGIAEGFSGHFVDASDPTFVPDGTGVALTPTAQASVREPISSTCTATPFDAAGSACQGAALGTPFFLFTSGSPLRELFADAYQPDTPATGPATAIGSTSASVSGSVNAEGASVGVRFEYGTSTAYGQATAVQRVAPAGSSDAAIPFSAVLGDLPSDATIHYRAVAETDFDTVTGPDQTLTTAPASPGSIQSFAPSLLSSTLAGASAVVGRAAVKGSIVSVRVSCRGPAGARCALTFQLTARESFRGRKPVAVTAGAKRTKLTTRAVTIGKTSVALPTNQSRTVKLSLNSTGRALLRRLHKLKLALRVVQALSNGHSRAISTQRLSLKAPRHRR